MKFDEIILPVPFRPIPWKRPAGKLVRYDSQIDDKNAFGILVKDILTKKYSERNWDVLSGANFKNNTPVEVSILFSFKDERKSTKGVKYPNPDVDNLVKFVLDALQTGYLEGLIWNDDKQVITLNATKKYGQQNEIYIILKRIEND